MNLSSKGYDMANLKMDGMKAGEYVGDRLFNRLTRLEERTDNGDVDAKEELEHIYRASTNEDVLSWVERVLKRNEYLVRV
jgi:hypothetical protein